MDVERLQGKLPNRINYKTNNQKLELYQMLSNKLSPVLSTKHSINSVEDAEIRTELSRLWDYKGDTIAQMPQTSYLRVKDSTGDAYFTLLKHNAHINQTSLLREQKNRLPEEDTMSAHPGFLGTYPNIHFEVNKKQLSEFVSGLGRLSDPQAYTAFVDRFGIRRTHPDFWKYSDEEHKAFKNIDPVSYGLLDYNRLENR
jgi:Fatty acid cis/trans isomerase (CTI).